LERVLQPARALVASLLIVFPASACRGQAPDEAGKPDVPSDPKAVQAGMPPEGAADAMAAGLNVVARLQAPAPPTGAPRSISGAERIANLRRAIESAEARLAEIRREIDDPGSEYATAEREFRQLDEKLVSLRKAIKEAPPEEAAKLQNELTTLEGTWKLAQDRFDLEIEERKALQEQTTTIELKKASDQAALDRLLGVKSPAAEIPVPDPAAAPGAPTAAPPADGTTNAPAPPASAPEPTAPAAPAVPAAAMPGVPAATAQAPAATPAAAVEAPSEEMVKAREDVEKKSEVAREAEQEEKSISERLAALDRNIALEKTLLETDRKKADNAEQSRAALARELEEKSVAGAPEAERREVARRLREADARVALARREARGHSDRLDELQSERAELLAQQLDAARTVAEARKQVEVAEKKIAQLENPFAPMNLLRWAIDHGPRLLAIFVAMIILHWVSRVFTRRVVKLMAHNGIRGSREEREARANTLVGVFHNAVSVAVYIGGILMILQEVGIPIAPLLGGAAIFGLAVAFGAQNLIRDYFYGFVILLENQYKLNDVVKIGDHSGQVERITLRMTVLRDLEGNVHFLPNGEITSVTNMTHGWSRALFDIGIAYREDVDRVIEVLQELGRELRADPAWRLMILEDLEMLGVDAFGDSAVVLKFLIKTRTLKQWAVKREMLRRIKNKFGELGIEIPFTHRTVYHRVEGEGQTPAEEISRKMLRGHHGPGL
jgi:small-conductance mechanosensitive channel